MKLRKHSLILPGQRVALRPMTERDWDILLKWNNDPEILYYSEGDDVSSHTLERVQKIYRSVSQSAFCFMMECSGRLVGECWLQRMNLDRILMKYPEMDCRRIDLVIGEKTLWGHGLGTEVIGTLTRFAFEDERAEFVFGCDIADYNPHSLRAFQKNGYEIHSKMRQFRGGKARFVYDVVLSRHQYHARNKNSE